MKGNLVTNAVRGQASALFPILGNMLALKFQSLDILRMAFQTGLDVLLSARRSLLKGKRVGLLAHPASVDAKGVHSSQRLREALGKNLVALFGPEHGYFGAGGAGEIIRDGKHPAWGIPIHSLYGDQRKPTPDMLKGLDILIFDLQDIAVRCYTFVSTLRYVMEACAEQGKPLIVCDRPIPFPNTIDGPMLDPKFESFVAMVNFPLVYGMTPAESASYLNHNLNHNLHLILSKMRGWTRSETRPAFPWIPPSPGIRSWETAWCYPATVWAEALTAIDIGRGGPTPFQVVTAPWLDAEKTAAKLNARKLTGVNFQPYWGKHPGIRLVVTNPRAIQPVTVGLEIVRALGKKAWTGAREDWFDKLAGTDRLRLALKAGRRWTWSHKAFLRERSNHLLY